MTRNEIQERLKKIIDAILSTADSALDSRDKNSLAGLDSLKYVQIMIALEEKFGLRFRLGEIMDLKTFEHLTDCILRKLASKKENP